MSILRVFNWFGLATYIAYFWGLAGGWRMPLEMALPLAVVLLVGHCYLFFVLRE